MSKVSTMNDFSRSAVEDFIQTVVFVDDKIYAPPPTGTVLELKKPLSPKTKKASTKSAAKKIADAEVENLEKPEDETQFSPHDIQSSFAKKHIVCSLHQPQKNHSVGVESDTYKLCACADIVIVDWDLYGDAGIKATLLIENLVIQSLKDDPHQLRLVLIYTSDQNLFDIADKVSRNLSGKIPDEMEYKKEDQGLAFHTLNARVVVLGKPKERTKVFKSFEETEQGLANRAIKEFCNLTDGLLQGSILLGLAAIRKQSRKILTKFHSGLDPAFLTHRALGLPHEESFGHIIPLLVAEIEAVLEDCLPTPLIEGAIIESWCKEKWEPTTHTTQFIPEEIDAHSFASEFCMKGMKIVDSYELKNQSNLKKTIKKLKDSKWPSPNTEEYKQLVTYLSDDTSGLDLRELAVLMSQRTYYENHRYLSLGTIIQEAEGEERYLLCLQPVCDCIRLKEESTFIFSVLKKVTGDKATHVVSKGKGFDDLVYKPGIESCVVLKFKPTKGFITANSLEFIDYPDAKSYQWIAQLKSNHAQNAAEQFSRNLSRVGLTESEWLRLKSK